MDYRNDIGFKTFIKDEQRTREHGYNEGLWVFKNLLMYVVAHDRYHETIIADMDRAPFTRLPQSALIFMTECGYTECEQIHRTYHWENGSVAWKRVTQDPMAHLIESFL